jgi:hypothetical protein
MHLLLSWYGHPFGSVLLLGAIDTTLDPLKETVFEPTGPALSCKHDRCSRLSEDKERHSAPILENASG